MKDQCWWVTGASGIGAALARRSPRAVLADHQGECAASKPSPATAAPAMILPFRRPITARSGTGRTGVELVRPHHGLVNNAGISQRSLAVDTDLPSINRLSRSTCSPIALTQQLLPRMVGAGAAHHAISTSRGSPGCHFAACAAKHGLIGYHDSVRAEHLGLKVLVVAPGSVGPASAATRSMPTAASAGKRPRSTAACRPVSPQRRFWRRSTRSARELVVAEGSEAGNADLPAPIDALFDRMSAMVQAGYAAQMRATAAS